MIMDLTWIDELRDTQSKDKIIELLDNGIDAYNQEFITLISKIKSENTEKDKDFIIELLIHDIKGIYSGIQKIIEYIKSNKGVDLNEIYLQKSSQIIEDV